MPFYFRKSKALGPLRLNFSKSGIGASVGVKGARMSFRPRGTQVNIGRGGIYYRKSLNTPPEARQNLQPVQPYMLSDQPEAIVTADVEELIDADSEEVLVDLNTPRGNFFQRIFGLSKPYPMEFELDDEANLLYTQLKSALRALAESRIVWQVDTRQHGDAKYNAGANTLITRKPIRVGTVTAPKIETNVEVLGVDTGRQRLLFFPDRLLIHQRGKYGAVSYGDLEVTQVRNQFVETDPVPSDAQVIGQTWRYVNRSGGPDRRFRDNRQIPIVLYGQIHFESPTGMNIILQASNFDAATHGYDALVTTLAKLSHYSAATPATEAPD